MSANLNMDPKEVLMHLSEMGYCNITPQMLDDFMRDLQRLIIYEANKKKKKSNHRAGTVLAEKSDNSSTMPSSTDESSRPSPSSPPPPPPPTLQRKHHYHRGSQRKDTEEVSCSSSELSLTPPKRVLRECSTRLSKDQQNEKVNKDKAYDPSKAVPGSSKSCDCLWRRIGCKCYEENREEQALKTKTTKENIAPPRPKSSFIRTWQVTGQPRPGSAPQRSDPVALYHHYQQIWKQQKLPGEARHNDLRWSIREKMLGQEPQPRNRAAVAVIALVNQQIASHPETAQMFFQKGLML